MGFISIRVAGFLCWFAKPITSSSFTWA
uniref:Uncharacterized protein n=1 Tax=Arundo donax TaxID=35708 RepID=A0A0A9F4C6_ARUDO